MNNDITNDITNDINDTTNIKKIIIEKPQKNKIKQNEEYIYHCHSSSIVVY